MKSGRINWQVARFETHAELAHKRDGSLVASVVFFGVILAAACTIIELVGAVIALQ